MVGRKRYLVQIAALLSLWVGGTLHSSAGVQPQAGAGVPVVFNAPLSARPGDIVGLQGENFGSEPVVLLAGENGQVPVTLPLVNQFGSGWLSFQIPASAQGALVVQIDNGQTLSDPVRLNAARAYHLDAMQMVPRGAFRLFGRNLLLPGFTPVVTVDGLPAVVDVTASDEHMLLATAPSGLRMGGNAVIAVDNGNGTGPSLLDRVIEVRPGSGGDPFALGVGWASGFARVAARVVGAGGRSRQDSGVACNGVADDTAAVQSVVDFLAAAGGGVLRLPSGTCRFAGSVQLKSRVVLQGAGKDRTVIRYEASYPIWGRGLDLVGVRDLTLTNTRGQIESPLLQDSTRVFIQNVRFELGGGVHMYLTGNTNMVVSGSDFVQPRNPKGYGPYTFGGCSGLVFSGNTTSLADGAANFPDVHDAYIGQSRFTRDARDNQSAKGVTHSLTMDFAHRIAIVGNSFDVLGGPIVNKFRNDGETLLTEGGGGRRTENLGTVLASTANTLSDPGNTINVHQFGPGPIPENYGVAIVGGKGAGQTRRVTGYASGTITVDRPWDVVPDVSSHYATFVWGLEKSLIKGNTLAQNPRGIWLYQTAIREVDIVDNVITEGGGIYLRSAQNLGTRSFVPMLGVRIANNRITNTDKQWRSYISVMFVRMDEPDFGVGTIGVEVRNNTLQANNPNLSMPQEESGGAEGFVVRMHAEGPTQALSKNQTRLLGTIFQNNQCIDCAVGVIVREGAKATVQEGNRVTATPH